MVDKIGAYMGKRYPVHALILVLMFSFVLSGCGRKSSSAGKEKKEEAMIEAEENAEETPVKTDTKYEDFVGTWKTVTEMADDAFGGFEITFHKNKKFDAVITGEEEKGKCTFADGVTTAQNEVVNAQFWFNDEGIMVVLDENGAMAMLKKVK